MSMATVTILMFCVLVFLLLTAFPSSSSRQHRIIFSISWGGRIVVHDDLPTYG
jgi:hypothetical protein